MHLSDEGTISRDLNGFNHFVGRLGKAISSIILKNAEEFPKFSTDKVYLSLLKIALSAVHLLKRNSILSILQNLFLKMEIKKEKSIPLFICKLFSPILRFFTFETILNDIYPSKPKIIEHFKKRRMERLRALSLSHPGIYPPKRRKRMKKWKMSRDEFLNELSLIFNKKILFLWRTGRVERTREKRKRRTRHMWNSVPIVYLLFWHKAYEESNKEFENLHNFKVVQFEWFFDNLDDNMEILRCWMHLIGKERAENWRELCQIENGKSIKAVKDTKVNSAAKGREMSSNLTERLSLRLRPCVDCLVYNIREGRRKDSLFGEWLPWMHFV